jgi:3-hydroxyacyl-CoA dehydrogenase
MKHIVVIGGGTMGNGIAHMTADELTLADFIGLDVCLAILTRARRRIRRSEIPAVPAARQNSRRRMVGQEIGKRLLPVLKQCRPEG